MTTPAKTREYFKNDPETLQVWNHEMALAKTRREICKAARTNAKGLPQVKELIDAKLKAQKDTSPNVYLMDIQVDNWSSTAAEWTAQPVTGSTSTFNDAYFQQHISGLRLHADSDSTQIRISDGSIPLQFSADATSLGQYPATSVLSKFYFECTYAASDATTYMERIDINILEVDSSNTAVKTRLDIWRDFGSDPVIAVQIMLENVDMGTYWETRLRFNLSDDEINENNGTGEITLYGERIPQMTVAMWDKSQAYDWANSEYGFNGTVYDNDYNSQNNNFKGVTFYRRVPKTALRAALLADVVTSVPAPTVVTAETKNSTLTWVTFILLLVLSGVVVFNMLGYRLL